MTLVRFTRPFPRAPLSRLGAPSGLPMFDDVESRMSRFIDRLWNEPFGKTSLAETVGWVPAMEIVESPKELTLTAELPGIDPKDVDVSVDDGVLTLRGEKTEERKENDASYDEGENKIYLFERSYGSFHRSFSLPLGVDGSKVTAEFAKGVLTVHMPKNGHAKPKGRKIEIKHA